MQESELPKPKKGYRTVVLLLLTLVYGFNFIDRQIVGILAPFIQADLDLTNTQLGLLIGLAFAAFYTIMGIPLAYLADRMNRVTLLSMALAVWSGFTALTGFSQNFLHIAMARIGVGVGEAGGSPPSHSMISDFYGKEERAGALGVYSLGIPLGIMSAYFFTAVLLGADATKVNWRRIFIILGATGIALAILVRIVIREPKRGAMETSVKLPSGYISIPAALKQAHLLPRILLFGGLAIIVLAMWKTGSKDWPRIVATLPFLMALPYFMRLPNLLAKTAILAAYAVVIALAWFVVSMHWLGVVLALPLFFTMFLLSIQPGVMKIISIKTWWWMCLGIATASFASYAISGFQTKYLRLLDPEFSFQTIIIWIGIINGTFYVAGTYFGAKFVDRKAKTDIRAYGTIPAISIAIVLPLAIAAFWVPTIVMHLAIGAMLQLFLGVYLGPSFAIAQTLAPINLRAMSTALFFFVLNMIALGGGPTFAGMMIDVFLGQGHSDLEATRYAMTCTFAGFLLSVGFYLLVRRTIVKDWAAAELQNTVT